MHNPVSKQLFTIPESHVAILESQSAMPENFPNYRNTRQNIHTNESNAPTPSKNTSNINLLYGYYTSLGLHIHLTQELICFT